MVNQSALPDERYPESDIKKDCDSVPERRPPERSYLAKFLRDAAQLLISAADYLERR